MAKTETRTVSTFCKCRDKRVRIRQEFILITASQSLHPIAEAPGKIKECLEIDCDVIDCVHNKDWSSGITRKSKQCLT